MEIIAAIKPPPLIVARVKEYAETIEGVKQPLENIVRLKLLLKLWQE